MKRVESNGMWTLMCPHQCPGLADAWGEEFERLYERWAFAFAVVTSFYPTEVPFCTSFVIATLVPRRCFYQYAHASYEREGLGRKTVTAQSLWFAILEAQTETGTPFMLYKVSLLWTGGRRRSYHF
jgi:hypothetical protein